MKAISVFVLLMIVSITINAQWNQSGDANRGSWTYTSGGQIGYSIRTQVGGGWAWQLVDGANNAYFHVDYPTSFVGIGTTTPRGKLDVSGQGDVYLTDDTQTGSDKSVFLPGHIYIAPYYGSDISYLQARRQNNSGSTNLQMRTFSNGTLVEAMRINSNGYTGIRTTLPRSPLDVFVSGDNNSVQTALILQQTNPASPNNSAGVALDFGIGNNTHNNLIEGRISLRETYWGTRPKMIFSLWDVNNTMQDRLTIDHRGYVGVGTNFPAEVLHVKEGAILSSNYNNDNIHVRIDGTSIPKINFARWTGHQSHMHNAFVGQFYNPSLGEYSFSIGTGFSAEGSQTFTSNVLTATLAGKVGIHTTNPRATLDVGLELPSGSLASVLGRISEGNGSGDGTFIGVRTYGSQPVNTKSFAIEHSFYGTTNSAVNFHRGGAATGGFLTFSTDNNTERVRVTAGGNVGIGTPNPDEKLTVKGVIHTEEVKVDLNMPPPDYVFDPSYELMPLSEVESYVRANRHLPDVPSGKQMEEEGLNLKEMNLLLLKKVEELTLHLIEQQKSILSLTKEVQVLKGK